MTAQEVIQKFMNKLANHGYSANTVTGEKMLDAAVKASSRFTGIQDVIDSMKADQKTCEQEAIREVVTAVCGEIFFNENCLNEDGSVKSLSEIETVLNAATKADGSVITKDDVEKFIGYQYHNLSDVIREVTANNFLKNYCGIELNSTFGFGSNGTLYRITNKPKGTDTGAITGSDAGGPINKTEKSVVPEAFINTYIASTEAAQSISTGTRDWVVQMTAANDTIVSGGADSINAGAGNDLIEVNGSGATVTSGEGTDKIKISAQVKDVTITDFNAKDVMTISGTFEIGSAKIEDMILVITDTTGTRKLKFAEFTDAQDGKLKINGASTTIGKWLAASGIDINTLNQTQTTYAASVGVTNSKILAENSQEISVDSDERTLIYPDWEPSTVEEPTVLDRRAPIDDRGELYESSNIPSDATITVDLATVDTDTAGNVEFGGQVVGTTSSTFPKATTFTRNGLTIHLLGGTDSNSSSTSKIKSKTFDQLTDDQKTIIAALFKWWEAETLKLNEESYGIGFNSDTVMVKDIGLYFYNNPISGVLATVFNWQRTADGFTTQLMLSVNMGYYSGIDNSDCNGVSSASGAVFLDRTLAHEMTHAIMAGNINFFNKLPKFIKEGFAELTHGIDDGRGNSIFKIAYDATQLNGSITLSDTGTGSQAVGDAYAGGYMFLRYFAKQAAFQTSTMPAFGDITVNVDLNALGNLEEGNILYIDSAQVNPTVMVAKDEKTFLNEIEDPTDTLINLGTIYKDSQGDFYYLVDNDLFTQNITTSTKIPEVYGANSKTIINGNDDYDGVIIVEGATSVNTGAGDDFINIKGQYATINAGTGNDSVIVSDGGHNLINLGEGNNSVRVYGGLLINNKTNYYSQHYGNTITGGAGNDTITNGDGLIIVDEDGNFYSYNDIAESVQKDENGNFYITFTDGKTSKVTPYIFDQHNHDYKIDLGNGNNVIELSLIYDNTIRTGKGDDVISTGVGTGNSIVTGAGNDSIYSGVYESKIFTGSGNDTLNFKYSNLNKNLIDLGENDDILNVGGSYNTVIAGEGNDTIKIYGNSAGKNIFVFGEDFGNDSMRGFMSNDTIKLIEGFTATVGESVEGAYTSNGSVTGTYQKFTLTVKNGDKIEGTIDIITASNQTFDAEKNIIYERKDSSMAEISTWEGTVATSFSNIDENAKIITIVKAAELALLAQNVNSGNTYKDWTIKLGIDLDLSIEDFPSIGDSETKSFEGTFDGGIYDEEGTLIGKHTITGLKGNGSLFGFVRNGGTIKNVDLKDATSYGKNNCCGVLVGSLNDSTVENCAAYNCTVSTVTGTEHVGGLIGSVAQNSTVTKCAAYNCVVYGYRYVGGLIGSAYGNVSDCTVINTTVNHTDTTYFGAMFGDSGSGISNNYYYNGSDQMKGNWQDSENTEYGTKELFKVTLPEGVSATGDGVKGIVDDEAYCAPDSTITLLSTTGTLKSIVNNGETLNSVRGKLTYQVQADTVFSNPQNFSPDNDVISHEPKDGDTLEFTNDASDYVTVKSGVSNFTINGGFRAEDKIVFEKTVTAVETIDGGFKAVYEEDGSEVSISGVDLASDEGEWKQQNEVASYASSINAGASLDNNNQIVYVGNKILTFELDGITNTKDFAVGRGLASLNTSGFGNTVSVKSNAGKYGFTIDGDGTDKTFNGMNDAENADIIFNYSDGIKINMFNGNDFVYSYRSNVTIDAGAGNDSIDNFGEDASINGGLGNDIILIAANNSSVNVSEGDDLIQVEAASVGSFKVEGFGAGDSIQFVQYNEGTRTYYPIATTSLSKDGDKLVAVAGNNSVTVEGVSLLSEESIGWSFDEERSKAIYGAQTVAGAKLDADGNIVYNKDSVDVMLEIDNVSSTPTLEGTTVKLSPSIMSVSDEVYVTKNVNGYTFEIGAGSYSGTKFYGTKTADTITNNGTNIFIDGMEGNDLITNNGASGVSISTAKGNDTIKVGADVQSFSVQSFAAGDVIELNSETTTLEAVTGGIKAGDVSIFGITDLASVNNSWQASETDITYKQTTVTGAQISGKTITYKTKSTSEDLFKIDGLNSSVGVDVAGDEVTLYQTALENSTGEVSISGGNYKFKLADDVDQVKEDTTGWKTLDSGNVAYLEGGTGSFYSLSGDSLSVSFNDEVVGENKVELSGVEGTVEFEGTTVKLTSSNFADNVSVVSNDGGYGFDLSEGDYESKLFNGSNKADSIVNAGTNISIDGAAGDDVITNNAASGVSISTATGNDTIKVGADVESFNVVAFEQGDELQFASNVESVSYDNGDLLVTIGSGVVTVKGMTAPTNVGEDWLNVKDGTATYGEMAGNKYGFNGKNVTYASETDNVKFTIGGLNKNASSTLLDKVVSIDGTTITFNTTDLFDTSKAVSISSGYTLAINDSIKPAAAGLSWTQDETDASKYVYIEAGNTDGYKVVNNQIVYDADTRKTFTLEGVANTTNVTVKDGKVTVAKSNLASGATAVKLTGNGYTLDLTGVTVGKPSATTTAKFGSVKDGKAAYTQTATTAEYWTKGSDNKSYSFTAKNTKTTDLFTLEGVANTTDVTVKDGKVTVAKSNLASGATAVKLTGDGYTLDLTGVTVGKPSATTTAKFGSVKDGKAAYTQSATTAEYWTKGSDNKSYSFTAKNTKTTDLFTLEGVANTTDVTVKDGKVTVGKSNLTSGATAVKLTGDGYTLDLTGVTVGKPSATTTAKFGSVKDGKAAYTQTATTAEYWTKGSDNKSYSFTAKNTKTTDLFTLEGVANTTDVTVSGKNVTVAKGALNSSDVELSGKNYTLKIASDVPTATTKTDGAFTKFASGTATYKTNAYSDYYTQDGNKLAYTAASGGKTISIKNLNTKTTLDKVKSGITVAEQKDGSYKITFKDAAVLTTKDPTVSASGVTYTVAVAKSLNPSALELDWKVSGTDASYRSDTSAGYTVKDNKVVYTGKVKGTPQIELGGLAKNASLSAPDKKNVLTLDAAVLGSNASLKSNDGGYTVKLTGKMSKKTFTGTAKVDTLNIAASNAAVYGGAGNDTFTVSGSKVTLTGGKGNDKVSLQKAATIIYGAGDGKDTVNFVKGMQISLSGSTEIKTLGKSGDDLVLGFGKNSSITVTGAKSTDTLKVAGKSTITLEADKFDLAKSLTFSKKSDSVKVAKDFTGELSVDDNIYLGNSKLSSVATINASAVTGKATISGNAKANTILGGKGNDKLLGLSSNDSLFGGDGNDTLLGGDGADKLNGGKGNNVLTGGKGNDVFIVGKGNDTITDYAAGDTVKVSGTLSDVTVSGKNVVLKVDKQTVTVKNAKTTDITLGDGRIVSGGNIYDSKKVSVTLGSGSSNKVDFSKLKVTNVDASAMSKSVTLTGDKNNNSIVGGSGADILKGGKGKDTLWGGAGNDSLYGGAGADTFIYKPGEGKDTIFDYDSSDALTILKSNGKTGGKFTKSAYSGGNLTLTIDGGGSVVFNGVSKGDKFSINSKSYTFNGKTLK